MGTHSISPSVHREAMEPAPALATTRASKSTVMSPTTISPASRTTTTATTANQDQPLLPHHSNKQNSSRYHRLKTRVLTPLSTLHNRTPYIRRLPLPVILIIALLITINLVIWALCALILSLNPTAHLLGTAALAYSLGLRHALDADHISAIDLMTRRLIATGQRPVTVGTWFSLGHSTIVVITSIVVAATAAGVEKRFGGFEEVGGIIGTSVSGAFLLILGALNAYILYKLVVQLIKVIELDEASAAEQAWKIEGGGILFRILKRMFKLIDKPWKMYPLGVLFGLGFDTSSEIALLGISSIQGARGTSIWLILVFPVLFTSGMCLVDTIDGALMMAVYTAPMGMGGGSAEEKKSVERHEVERRIVQGEDDGEEVAPQEEQQRTTTPAEQRPQANLTNEPNPSPPTTPTNLTSATTSTDEPPQPQIKSPLTFLYYSIVLTTLTVIVAIVIGTIQILSLILNVAHPSGPFWNGVATAGDSYEIIGGGICASFVVVGGVSVVCHGRFIRWVGRRRERRGKGDGVGGVGEVLGGGHVLESGAGRNDGGVVGEGVRAPTGKILGDDVDVREFSDGPGGERV